MKCFSPFYVLLLFSISFARAFAVTPNISFNGIYSDSGSVDHSYFSLHFDDGHEVHRYWSTIGDEVEGYRITEFSSETKTITLKNSTQQIDIPLNTSRIGFYKDSVPGETIQQRLLRMKAELEKGRRITGDVAVSINGKLVTTEVKFAVGEEIRIQAENGTSYALKAKLNSNGTLTYDIRQILPEVDGKPQTSRVRTQVTDAPWGGFGFETAGKKAFMFVPYE